MVPIRRAFGAAIYGRLHPDLQGVGRTRVGRCAEVAAPLAGGGASSIVVSTSGTEVTAVGERAEFSFTEHDESDGSVRVCLVGELDAVEAPGLQDALRRLEGEGSDVLLDVSGLSFMDLFGLHLIEEAADAARQGGFGFAHRRAGARRRAPGLRRGGRAASPARRPGPPGRGAARHRRDDADVDGAARGRAPPHGRRPRRRRAPIATRPRPTRTRRAPIATRRPRTPTSAARTATSWRPTATSWRPTATAMPATSRAARAAEYERTPRVAPAHDPRARRDGRHARADRRGPRRHGDRARRHRRRARRHRGAARHRGLRARPPGRHQRPHRQRRAGRTQGAGRPSARADQPRARRARPRAGRARPRGGRGRAHAPRARSRRAGDP